jgi:hypothetical protein
MMQQSAGSQPDPTQFAQGYAAKVADIIERLRGYRSAGQGDRALKGEEGMTVSPDRAQYYKS